MQFDIQQFLFDMRKELNDKLDVLGAVQGSHATRITVLEEAEPNRRLTDHEIRLVTIEGSHKLVRWFLTTAVIAVVGLIADLIGNHWFGK